ncbi:MAG: hypothetical protein M1838_002296 [Thelocarpon superellum]|nr:MAG: hypothetical protein M1838_002296 [Thelocarpon superellum]
MNVKPESSHGQELGYSNSPWVTMGDYTTGSHPAVEPEFHGYGYMNLIHPPPAEPSYTPMHHTPVHPAHHPHQPHQPHQPLRPLITPPWPSMLTSQSTFSQPILPLAPAQSPMATPTSAQSAHSTQSIPSAPSPSPRRTLTDADRRKMCIYHEENPTVKQTEIGAMFGVERSTVSKVLRQKEKYLSPNDGNRSPIKRSKGRFPDIERALSNWVRNAQKSGVPMTDAVIKEKARFFAATVGTTDSHLKLNNSTWLEKFKQKNHIGGSLSRRNSETTDSDGVLPGEGASASHTPNGISPTSPSAMPSPLPLSAAKGADETKTESPDSYVEFSHGFRLSSSQSSASLSSAYTDATAASFSAGPTSPTSPFFTSDPCGAGPFLSAQQARLPPLAAANSGNFSRPRSQTFPSLTPDPSCTATTASSSGEGISPKYLTHAPTFDAAVSDMGPPPPVSIDAAISPGSHHRTHSTPPLSHPSTSQLQHGPHAHQPSHQPQSQHQRQQAVSLAAPQPQQQQQQEQLLPNQDEARRALEVVMAFFQRQPTGVVDPQDFVAIGKLMEKLRLQGAAQPLPALSVPPSASSSSSSSGLQRIQEEREGGLKEAGS